MSLALVRSKRLQHACHDAVFHGRDGLALTHGGVLKDFDLAYRLEGAVGAPVVLALGGISAHRRVTGEQGWWPQLVGFDRAIDLNRVRVLSFDWLGGSGDSTQALDASFPRIDTLDQASALIHLLDHLEIPRLAAAVGASYGGLVVQHLLSEHPQRVARGLVVAAAHRPHPMATAWRCVQRTIIQDGLRSGQVERGVALARQLAMTTYRAQQEFAERFDSAPQVTNQAVDYPVQQYLEHCGERFADKFLPWAYLRLSESIDLHRVQPERIRLPFELIGFDSDQIAPPADLVSFHEQAPFCRWLQVLPSRYGHDGFLKEHWRLAPLFKRATQVNLGS